MSNEARIVRSLISVFLLSVCGWAQILPPIFQAQPSGGAPPTITKIGQLNFASSEPYTFTVSGNASPGDTVLLACWSQGYNAGTHWQLAVSDSVSNPQWVYPQASANTNLQFLDASDSAVYQIAYAPGISTGYTSGTTTVTVNNAVADGAAGGCDLFDITGLLTSPLDQIGGATSVFSATQTTATITPSRQPEIVFAMFGVANADTSQSAGNVIGSAATLLDNRTGGTNNPSKVLIEYRRVTATTSGNATATVASSSNGWGSLILSLKSN
jgi:hypothetical protein